MNVNQLKTNTNRMNHPEVLRELVLTLPFEQQTQVITLIGRNDIENADFVNGMKKLFGYIGVNVNRITSNVTNTHIKKYKSKDVKPIVRYMEDNSKLISNIDNSYINVSKLHVGKNGTDKYRLASSKIGNLIMENKPQLFKIWATNNKFDFLIKKSDYDILIG